MEAIALCRALEAFSPKEPEEREHVLEFILELLGFAAYTWLSTAYAQASGPEEMSELFPGAEVVESAWIGAAARGRDLGAEAGPGARNEATAAAGVEREPGRGDRGGRS